MKPLRILFILFTSIIPVFASSQLSDDLSFDVSLKTKNHEALKTTFVCVGGDDNLHAIGQHVARDVSFTDQFDVELIKSKKPYNAKKLEKLFDKGVSLCIAMSSDGKKKDTYKIVASDTSSAMTLFEKAFTVTDKQLTDIHHLSAQLVQGLTGSPGPFGATLTYCKTVARCHKVVCCSDYAGKGERVVVKDRALNVAPSWHGTEPRLFYSYISTKRCMLVELDIESKKRRTMCAYFGVNMQPSFSQDGSKSVVCLSRGETSQLFLHDSSVKMRNKKRHLKQLTRNAGTNATPRMLADDSVIFCSDYETGRPQIYHLDKTYHRCRRLTNGAGSCASPAYCPTTRQIVYTRFIDNVHQLFCLKFNKSGKIREKQLSFSPGDKNEPCFSPCGRYVYFSYSPAGRASSKPAQIAVINLASGRIRVVTSGAEEKGYPACSGAPWYAVS